MVERTKKKSDELRSEIDAVQKCLRDLISAHEKSNELGRARMTSAKPGSVCPAFASVAAAQHDEDEIMLAQPGAPQDFFELANAEEELHENFYENE